MCSCVVPTVASRAIGEPVREMGCKNVWLTARQSGLALKLRRGHAKLRRCPIRLPSSFLHELSKPHPLFLSSPDTACLHWQCDGRRQRAHPHSIHAHLQHHGGRSVCGGDRALGPGRLRDHPAHRAQPEIGGGASGHPEGNAGARHLASACGRHPFQPAARGRRL